MTSIFRGEPAPAGSLVQLQDKMLELGHELLLAKMAQDTLFACGYEFSGKTVGQYGWYETFNGDLIAFQPKSNIIFTLSYNTVVVKGNLSTIQAMSQRLSNYELSIAQ